MCGQGVSVQGLGEDGSHASLCALRYLSCVFSADENQMGCMRPHTKKMKNKTPHTPQN